MKKTVQIEVELPDGFVPPKTVAHPNVATDWKGACDPCPFFKWNEGGFRGWCLLLGEWPDNEECPLRKYFVD